MKALCFKLFLLITVLVVSGTNSFAQYEWTRHPSNPIFSGSGHGTWDKHVFIPMVLYNTDSSRYEMWYNGSYGPDVSGWYPFSVGLAYSPDGVTWTKYAGNPVLSPTVGSWDASMIMPGWVARESGQYKMWYYGSVNNIRKLGYATSPNGINWTKNPNPILSTGTAAWEAGGVLWPSILKYSGSYTMFYTGVNAVGTIYRLGRATSLDGINWQRDTINNPVLSVGAPGQWDDEAVTTGLNCLKIDNTIYMWYTGWSSTTPQRVGLATSTNDGVTWTKYSGNPVLNFGVTGSWDANHVESGTVLLEGNTLRMWYDGSRDNTVTNLWRIGIATSTLVVPVELTSFTAEALDQKVILKWTTATELNNNGFEIQRKVAESDFATVGFFKGEGTTTNQRDYSYIDKDLVDGKYFYRLKQVDYNGTYEYSNAVEVDVRSLNEYALEQNYPNPFNPVTTIGYILKEKINAKLILLNAIGEEVAVLVNKEQDKGFHKVEFNAVNLSSGVYFYQLKAGEYISVRKMILLK